MVAEWVKHNLRARSELPIIISPILPPASEIGGLIIRTGKADSNFHLNQQYLHKAIVLMIAEVGRELCVGVVLNRPTNAIVKLGIPGEPQRRLNFGGEAVIVGSGLDADQNGLIWLHRNEVNITPYSTSDTHLPLTHTPLMHIHYTHPERTPLAHTPNTHS